MSTPTVSLYYEDDHRREMQAQIVGISPGDVVLDQTVFYPRGGNQDSDKGTLSLASDEANSLHVHEVLKDEAGTIHHHVADEAGAGWEPGADVVGRLDWDRRLLLMRLHTAQHMISRWFIDHEGNDTTRVDITEAGCTIEFARPITLEHALAAVAEINGLIRQGRAVRRQITDGYIEIIVDEYDRQPCGGTHVADIAEIERVALLRHKQNRMEIAAGSAAERAEQQIATVALNLLAPLSTDLSGLQAKTERLLQEQQQAKAELFALREEVARHRIAAAASGIQPGQPVAIDLPMVESKALPKLLKPVQGPGKIYVCLCAGRNLQFISGAPDKPANALADRVKSRWNLSGGGSPAVAMCGPLPEDATLDQVMALLD